jgi:hypothetical protein
MIGWRVQLGDSLQRDARYLEERLSVTNDQWLVYRIYKCVPGITD